MNPDNLGQNNSSTEWIPLSEAAQFTPYSADYLSLLARKRRLTAKKIDGIWYTTKGIINNYLTQQAKRAEALNQNTESYLPFISDSAKDVPEAPESNVQYSRTYADDFQKIRPATSEQVVAEETKSVTGSESSSVKLPPVLVPLNEIRSVNVATVSVKENLSREENKLTPAVGVAAPNYSSNEVSKTEVQVAASVDPLASKSVSGDALMEEFMRRFNAQIDRQVDSQHGFLFKISRFIRRSYGYTLRSPKRLPLFIVCLFLVVILPFRFVSGFADTFFTETMHAVKNAQTVMGFRPGTHENEILLLGPEGEIAIYGNVETEGQFRSYVEDGIAPITVKSTTKVDNLNADMLDGVSGHEFTLAYVTKNGNVTHEPVFLEGTVEVGQTLLVKGATKLLNSLQVDGNLSVFGEANFARGISVSGPAVFKNILTAPSVIVSDLLRAHKLIVEDESIFEGLVTIKDDLDVEGSITASSGRINGSFRVEEGFHAMQNVSLGSDAYTVRITSAEWSVDNDGNAVFADIIGEEASFSSLSVGGNASASTFTATNPNSTSTFQGALSVGTTTSYEMLTLDGALYLASIAAPSATSSRLHNQDGTLYWAGSAFAGPTLGTWSTDGTNVWRTTGNVGIGTSSPNAQLHVDGGDVLFNSAGGGPGFYFDESNGRLGLGTTTPAQTLTVVGSARITGSLFDSAASAGTSGMILSSTGSGTSWIATSTLASNYFQQDGNSFGTTATLGTNDTNDLAFETDNSTRMTIDTNGNVGIGTTSPNQKFQVSGGGIKLDNNQNLIWRNSANTGDTSVLALSGDTTILRGGGGAPTMQLQTTGGSAIMSLLENGNVGIGTTTPTQLFSVAGNTYITGGLGIGIATTSSGVLETAGNARIGGDLAVVGTTTTDKLAVNSYVISDLIPEVNAFYNLGSSARYWNDAYIDTLTVNNISAASTSISGTQSESFTINSDNATADTENMDLVFYRGTVVPNALISWDAVRDRFDINQPFFIQNDSSTTTVVTLDVHGTAGQTADIFRVASSTGTSFLNVTTGGNVGIGETAPGSKLSVSGGGSFGASYDTTAAPTNGLIIEGNVGIGTTTPTTQLQLYRTSNAFPATSGSTQSAGQQLRLGGGAQAVLDFGSNGTSGAWIQSTLGTNLATNYPLLLNPNGGNVGIGTTSPSQMLSVGATTGSQFLVTSAGAVTDGSWTADVIADDYGGTGQSTYSTGDMLYASGANTLAKRTIGSTGNVLSVVGGVPTWSATSTLGFITASDFDTCAEFAAIMTGETGTCGSVVLSVGPTFTGNTTLANASSTNLTNSGASYFGGLMSMTGSAANIALGSNYLSGDGGDEGVFVDSSGNVGIGESTPLATLSVGDASSFTNNASTTIFHDATALGSSAGDFRWMSEYRSVGTFNTNRLLIGTNRTAAGSDWTTSAWRIQPAVDNSFTGMSSNRGYLEFAHGSASAYSGVGINGDGGSTPDLMVNTSGNVGIGTTTPDRRLSVVGASGTSVAKFDLVNATADTVLELSSDDGFIASGSNFLSWSDAGTTLGVIRGDGNVGIGDTSPTALLTVGSGDLFQVNSSGLVLLPAGATGAGNLALSTTGDTNTGLYFSAADTLTVQAGGTNILDVTTDGIDVTGVNNNIVGDSTDASGTTVVLSVTGAQSVAHTGTHIGIDSNPTYTAASGNTLVAMNGMRALPQNSSSGTITTLRGLIAQPQNISTGDVTSMMGVYALPINTSTGTTTTIYGMISQPRASNGGVTNMYGMYSDCGASGASASVTTCYGLFVAAPTLTGTMGNAYAIWVADNDIVLDNDGTGVLGGTTGSTLFIGESQDLELYHDGTDSYIMNNTGDLYIGDAATDDVILSNNGGKVGIGTTTPAAKLNVLSTTEQLRLSYSSSVYWSDVIASDGGRTLTGFGSDGDLDIIFTGATDGDFSINGDDLFVDTSAGGFVGIGDATPAALLTVGDGDLYMVTDTGIVVQDQSSATYDVWIQGSTSAGGDLRNLALIGNATNDDLILNYNTEYDCVSIGGTACTEALTVTGTISSTGAITEAGSAVLSAADLDTCAEFAALGAIETGTCGSLVLSASPTLTGTLTAAAANFSGDVGIGSGAIIDFADTVADKIHYFTNTYGTGIEGSTLTNWSGAQFRWRTGGTSASTGTERMLLTTTGLSITGTADVSGALEVTGDINGNAKTIARTTDSWLRLNPDGDFTSGMYLGTGITRTDGTLQVGASGATLSVVSGGDFLFDTSLLALDNSSNSVGMGTAAPSAQLEVFGVGQLVSALTDAGVTTGMLALNGNSSSAGAGGALTFGNAQSVTAGSVGYAAIKGLLTNGSGNTIGDLAFSTRNATTDTALTERMRILSTGNVGIGDSSPASLFTVGNGDLFQVNSSGSIIQASGITMSNGANRTLTIETEGVGTAGRALILKGGNGGSGGGVGGNILIGGGSPGGVGDIGYTILGHNGSATGNVGIQDTTPTEAMLVVGAAGAGDIYSTLATAGTTNNAVCWDNAGATLLYDCDATPADYAESYPVDEGVTYGDIVMTSNDTVTQTDGQTVSKLVKAKKGSEHAVIGIVSNNYHDFTSAGSESIDPEDNPMPVALSGRVPVKVNLEGGEIEVGDSVILSSEPGVATKATSTGERIGIALESYESGDDTILVFVDNGMYYAPDFLAFITKSETVLSESEDTVFDKLITLAESFVDGVLKLASAEIQYVKADKVETNELCVGSVCVDEGTFLQMVESSGGAVHAMEHEPEPEPEEETGTSTDNGAGEGETGDTTSEQEDTETEEPPTETEEETVSEETTPDEVVEEQPEEETPNDDTEEVATEEVTEEPALESAG